MDHILQVIQNKLICSICRNCFVDPITINCGHSFCRPCFNLNWLNRSVLAHCSECQEAIQEEDFKTNVTLKQIVLIVRKASLWQFLHSVGNECMIHMEAKQIFCEEQRSLLCTQCSTSQEHGAHRHGSAEEAAEQLREKLLEIMGFLWEKYCLNDRNLKVETATIRSWETYVISKGSAVRGVYKNLPSYFYLEKDYYLEKLTKEANMISGQLRDNGARMIEKRELLIEMYTEMKEMCHKPDVEMLLDFGNILFRGELLCIYTPQPLKPELTVESITWLIETFNFFKVNITLQHRSTPDHVFLQGDLINLRVGCGSQGAPYTSPLAECFYHWDAQTFTTGRHYWEIAVGDTCDWALGVSCNDWVQENVHLHKAFYLLGCAETDMHHKVFTTSPHLLQYVPRPTGRVGIFLDYEGRSVTFVNVAKRTLICRIDFCSFSSHLRPILCCSHF
uniref:Uncharacterized protein n=1 Tax=Pipistrellus kuhlii TaxID=59472 RepID=A0A7J7X2E8_PIPKU|nr:hypothetical protein mPipKuh1_018038 [Pipistrellus kuhlii]